MLVLYFIFLFLFVGFISWLWATGIDNMNKKHPDYKGKDFLDWDDDKVHTEGNI